MSRRSPLVDLPIVDRLALQGITLGERRGIHTTLVDANSGEPIAFMTASDACEFLRFAEGEVRRA